MNNTHQNHCSICLFRIADKTNSHIIPSFYVSMVSSVDDSYKRGKELLFTIHEQSTSTYIGRDVLPEQLEDSFEVLSDERIAEMSKSDMAYDHVFCSHCEQKLGEYLESPYHAHILQGRRIPTDVAYFYWVSIIWRVAKFDIQRLDIPKPVVNSLGRRLNNFIQLKDENADTSYLMEHAPFTYKILYNKDYSKREAGIIHLEYDKKQKLALFILGDVVFCASFSKHGFTHAHIPYGLDSLFASAPENNGQHSETVQMVNADRAFNEMGELLLTELNQIRLSEDRKKIIRIWQSIINKEPRLPRSNKPCEEFIHFVISELYSEGTKNGERFTISYFKKCFGKGLEKIYGIPIDYDES